MHPRASQPQRRAGARPLTVAQPHYQPSIAAAVEGFIPRTFHGPDVYANLKAYTGPEKIAQLKNIPYSPLEIFVPVAKPLPQVQPPPLPQPAEIPAASSVPKVELGPALATFLRTCLEDESLVRSEVTAHQASLTCASCQEPMTRRRRASDEAAEGFLFRCKNCGIIKASGHTLPTIEGDLARAATNSSLLLSTGRPEPKQLLFVVDSATGTTVLDPVTLMFREAGQQWDRSFLYRVIKSDDNTVELEPANIPKAEGLISTNVTVKRNATGDLEIRVNPLRPARPVKWRLPVKGAQIGEFIEKLQRRDPLAIPVWFQVDAASGRQTLVQLEGAVQAAAEDPANAAGLFEAVAAAVVARGWFLEPLQPGSPPGTERVPLVDKSARAQQLRSVLAAQLSASQQKPAGAAAEA